MAAASYSHYTHYQQKIPNAVSTNGANFQNRLPTFVALPLSPLHTYAREGKNSAFILSASSSVAWHFIGRRNSREGKFRKRRGDGEKEDESGCLREKRGKADETSVPSPSSKELRGKNCAVQFLLLLQLRTMWGRYGNEETLESY